MNDKTLTIDVTPSNHVSAGEQPLATVLAPVEPAPRELDLNRLEDILAANRVAEEPRPAYRARRVFVDPEGRIWLGDEISLTEEPLSEVPQSTFASLTKRQTRDLEFVQAKMPSNTRFVKVGRTGGWLYSFNTECGDAFQLFAYWEGDSYQVKVVKPAVEGVGNPHECHLFPDGSICFGTAHKAGMRTLEDAYPRSVLWANGFSVFHRTGKFPF